MSDMRQAPAAAARPQVNVALLMIALLMVDGLHFVFARALRDHLPPATSVLYVLGVGTLQLTSFAAARGRLHWSTFRRHA